MADHHHQQQSLESEGGSPPAKRARLDPSTSETSGKLVGAKVGLAKVELEPDYRTELNS